MSGLQNPLKQRERVLMQRADADVVLLNLDSGEYFALNEVGSRVWELCDGMRTSADIVTLICQEYDAPVETIKADVLGLITDLVHERLVIASDPATGAS